MAQLSVIFCWHMHQPFYREAGSGRYHLPWVYLHAIKDYTDMAAILEQVPGAHATVNFVPSLTEQIHDYAVRIRHWMEGKGELPDPLLDALAERDRFEMQQRHWLLDQCFRLNHERNLHRYPPYSRIWQMAEHAKHQGALAYLSNQFFFDLVTWYHLAWLGETVRDGHFIARRLLEKGEGFTRQDRMDLLKLILHLLEDVNPRYKRLAVAGKIELSTTPYAHPILPLLIDFSCARETVPDAILPAENYPGGVERARDHIEAAIAAHHATFGLKAKGCWPAEGGVSEAALALLAEAGFQWTATGEGVLHHSLGYNVREHFGGQDLYQPWWVGRSSTPIACFFRDDRLSDLIGFEYQRWNTGDAVNHFMHELLGIHHRTQGMEAPVVSIIMDGENAWEHYPNNGVPFLTRLYQAIADHPNLKLTTFSQYLAHHKPHRSLTHLVPGSWVYGNFSTWIGDPAKTRGWELLIQAKHAFDRKVQEGGIHGPKLQQAIDQLRVCEGSDWTWWFGDYNPAEAVRDFDRLYRQHLKRLYEMLDEIPPKELERPISAGGGDAEAGGTMRRGFDTT